MRAYAFLMAAVMTPFVAYAAPKLVPKNEWKYCEQDAHCVRIKGTCRPAAVNAVFQAEAERYYAQEAKQTKCPQEFWHPPTPVPRCRLNGCELVQQDK